MKIAFYCRIGGKGYGFLLPEDAEKLREFFCIFGNRLRLKKLQAHYRPIYENRHFML